MYTEFEMFYQNLLKNISNIPETKLQQIKTKLLSTCDKFAKIKVRYKHRKIVYELSKRNDIVILKADKGRGVVILDRRKYTKKCLAILNLTQFQKLNKDPTKTMERKVQNILRKINSKLTINEYKQLYSSGSSPGKCYGTAKIHKLSDDDNVEKLPIRPIISNIGTATYNLAKYLSKLISPGSSSEYTVSSTKNFAQNIRAIKVPTGYHMVSFDVKSLFMNVPLEYTIDLILKIIYDNGELSTDIARSEMKEMLTLCTKNVHFTFNGDIYLQTDGVAMGSPLGPVLAGIFMVHLERYLVPVLKDQLSFWKRYVDDTITFLKTGSAENVLSILNSFHPKIEFTYETEVNSKLAFLDVLLLREDQNIITTVYRKLANSDIYLNWNSFCPQTWKGGTLRSLVQRAHLICSIEDLLKTELNHI